MLRIFLERMESPVGQVILGADARGVLRVLDFADYETRMHRLLQRQYGKNGFALEEARASGIVRIEIVPRSKRRPDLETGLQRAFGLREAVVVPGPGEDDATALEFVAEAAGRYFASIRPRLPLIGVSWGRTMSAVAQRLPAFWNEGVEVVLLNGAMNIRSPSTRTNNTAELFARSANGTATLLPVPAILGHAATRVALEQGRAQLGLQPRDLAA